MNFYKFSRYFKVKKNVINQKTDKHFYDLEAPKISTSLYQNPLDSPLSQKMVPVKTTWMDTQFITIQSYYVLITSSINSRVNTDFPRIIT